MHELGIVVHLIDRLEEIARKNNAKKVLRVTLEIGEVSGIVNDLFLDAYTWSKKKSEVLYGSELEIIPLKAFSYCRDCRNTFSTVESGKKCPKCKSENTYLLTGDEINIRNIEVENG